MKAPPCKGDTDSLVGHCQASICVDKAQAKVQRTTPLQHGPAEFCSGTQLRETWQWAASAMSSHLAMIAPHPSSVSQSPGTRWKCPGCIVAQPFKEMTATGPSEAASPSPSLSAGFIAATALPAAGFLEASVAAFLATLVALLAWRTLALSHGL
jgi:hypothetical protein